MQNVLTLTMLAWLISGMFGLLSQWRVTASLAIRTRHQS